MTTPDQVRELVAPVVAEAGVDLWDVEWGGGVVRVFVDRAGGLDLDVISGLTRTISRRLDEHDPIPGRYVLEVSSPGLERTLRTPAHFCASLGREVSVKTRPDVEGQRRRRGVLIAADEAGFTIRTGADGAEASEADAPGEQRLAYDDVERVRTVFEWGPPPRGTSKKAPGSPRDQRKKAGRS